MAKKIHYKFYSEGFDGATDSEKRRVPLCLTGADPYTGLFHCATTDHWVVVTCKSCLKKRGKARGASWRGGKKPNRAPGTRVFTRDQETQKLVFVGVV